MKNVKDTIFSTNSAVMLIVTQRFLPYVIAAVLVVAVLVGYLLFARPVAIEPVAEEPIPEISGTLFMSMAYLNTNDPVNIYSLNIGDESSQVSQITSQNIHYGYESINKNNAFVITNAQERQSPLSIYFIDFEAGATTELPTPEGLEEEGIDWSYEVGAIAYTHESTTTPDYVDYIDINNWEVVLFYPLTGQSVIIENATQPVWSPDGTKVLYQKTDGLYLYTVASDEHTKVFSTDRPFNRQDMFSVSENGSRLIKVDPAQGLIEHYAIENWDTLGINFVHKFQEEGVNFYWPTFSPDGYYYVVQAIDVLDSGVRINPRLEIRIVGDDKSVVRSFPLPEVDFDQAFVDDWVQ